MSVNLLRMIVAILVVCGAIGGVVPTRVDAAAASQKIVTEVDGVPVFR